MIIDWALPFSLETPYADIDFNRADGIGMKLVPEECVAAYEVRRQVDNIPQADGGEIHFGFKTPYVVRLTADLYATKDQIACGSDLTILAENLDGALSSILNPPDQLGRLVWTPEGHGTYPGARMFNLLNLLEAPVPQQQPAGAIRVRWAMISPFPYAIDEAERDIDVNGTTIITNAGNADYWPVIKVNGGGGGVSNFIISNVDTGVFMSYDGATIPAGEYLEINTFKNTAFLNGDETNELDGFEVQVSDFFTLQPGDNQIDTNVDTTWLVNNAWT